MTAHTRTEIANNWTLWQEYADPSATMTRDEFDAMPLAEKLQIQVDCFGPEEDALSSAYQIICDNVSAIVASKL